MIILTLLTLKMVSSIGKGLGQSHNVLGTQLKLCCSSPMTGWFRDGYCRTDDNDMGRHVVCALITDEFLAFSK